MSDSKTAGKFLIGGAYGLFLAFAFFLLFYHLDNRRLWGDETETAVLAKNVMQFGVPRTYDGTNYIMLHGTIDETPDHIWRWSPWMQEYITASSFMLLGQNTWAARAPFTLVGWCCLVALALVAHEIYRSHRVALASVALLGASEVFLLHARQCRYYPISVLGEILLVYGIYLLFNQNRRGIWFAAFALVLQFYSNYIIMSANLPVLLILAWLLRKQGKQSVLRVVAVAGISLAAALPWVIYAHLWRQGHVAGQEFQFGKAWDYLLEFHFHFVPLWIFLLPLLGWVLGGRSKTDTRPDAVARWEQFLLLLLPSYFVANLIAPGCYLRYLLPVLPVACLLAAVWIFRHIKWPVLAALLVAVLASCNALSVFTAYPFRGTHTLRLPLVEYVKGLELPYTNRFDDVLDFFKKQAHPGDRILSFDPEFPLMFYAHLTVINGNVMGMSEGQWPEWILPDTASGVMVQRLMTLPDFAKPFYETITIPVHDSVKGDGIPEPDDYQYQSVQTRVPFVIYRLKTGANNHQRP